jgi:hypothetical protein
MFKTGNILRIQPASRSHVKESYLVKVLSHDDKGFSTKLIDPRGHKFNEIRRFDFERPEWKNYHKKRFSF